MNDSTEIKNEWKDVIVADKIEHLLNRAFYLAEKDGGTTDISKLRFKLFILLLKGIGEYLIGLDSNKCFEELRSYLKSNTYNELQKISEEIQNNLSDLSVKPTYSAISYWSPIDKRRHTVSHRLSLNSEQEELLVSAYAYAFYSLTHKGAASNHYSLTQYIATEASKKRKHRVCYLEENPYEGARNWLHIPFSLHSDLLKAAGIEDRIKSFFLNDKPENIEELKIQLGKCLSNIGDDPWTDINNFAEGFLNSFEIDSEMLSQEAKDLVLSTQMHITDWFGGNLDFKQAFFMLIMNLLYLKACPTNYIYTYPVRVAEQCCVITLGTDELLIPSTDLTFGAITRSIFIPPLLLDYARREAEEHAKAEKSETWKRVIKMMNHRIGNPLRHIYAILTIIRSSLPNLPGSPIHKLVSQLNIAALDINNILNDVLNYIKNEEYEITTIRLDTLVQDVVTRASEDFIELYPNIKYVVHCPAQLSIWGNEQRLKECFEEMLNNSRLWTKENALNEIEINVAIPDFQAVPSSLDPTKSYVIVTVTDKGYGIPQEFKPFIFNAGYTMRNNGTGFGLTWIKSVIEKCGGTIYEDGVEGARFTIFLRHS